jgi:hypothetical protein
MKNPGLKDPGLKNPGLNFMRPALPSSAGVVTPNASSDCYLQSASTGLCYTVKVFLGSLSFPSRNKGRVAQLAEQLTLNQ